MPETLPDTSVAVLVVLYYTPIRHAASLHVEIAVETVQSIPQGPLC